MRFFRSIAFRLLFSLSLIGCLPLLVYSDIAEDVSSIREDTGNYLPHIYDLQIDLQTAISYLVNLPLIEEHDYYLLQLLQYSNDQIDQYGSNFNLYFESFLGALGFGDLSICQLLNEYYSEVGPTYSRSVLDQFSSFLASNPGVMLTSIESRVVDLLQTSDSLRLTADDILSNVSYMQPYIYHIDGTTVDIKDILTDMGVVLSSYFQDFEDQFHTISGHADAIVGSQGNIFNTVEDVKEYIFDLSLDFNRFTDHYLDPSRVLTRDNLFDTLYSATCDPFSYQFRSSPLSFDGSPSQTTNGFFVLQNRTLEGDSFFSYVANGLRLQLEQQANANNYLYNILAQIQSVEKNQEEIDSAVASANAQAQTIQSEYESVSSNSPSSALTFDGLHRTYTSPSFDPSPNLPSELYFELPGVPPFVQSTTEVHIPISEIRGFIDNVRSCFTFIWWLLVVLIHVSCYALVVKFIKWVIAFYGNMTLTPH